MSSILGERETHREKERERDGEGIYREIQRERKRERDGEGIYIREIQREKEVYLVWHCIRKSSEDLVTQYSLDRPPFELTKTRTRLRDGERLGFNFHVISIICVGGRDVLTFERGKGGGGGERER